MGHIQEFQRRLVLSALFLVVAGSTAYYFKDQIITALLKPLDGQTLMYLNPAGGFSFILMVSIYTAIAFSAPFIIHQLYCFLRPALSKNVQKKSVQILVFSSLLLISGILFGYFFAIPGALQFLQEFAGDYINSALTADAYLQFIVAYTLGLGLVFQLPLLLMLIHWIKPLTPGGLMKSERWIIVLSFIAAAIITPTPDPLNQTIIALPIIVIYQFGVVAVLVNIYRTKKANKPSRQPATAPTQPPLQPQTPVIAVTSQPADAIVSATRQTPLSLAFAAPDKTKTGKSIDGIRKRPAAKQPAAPVRLESKPTLSVRQAPLSASLTTKPSVRQGSPRFAIDGISSTFQLSR